MIDWLACTLVKSIGWLLCRLPPGVAVWCGERLGLLAYWLQPKRRQVGLRNLRAAFDGQLMPAQARRIIVSSFKQMGAGVLELLRLPVMDRAYIDRYISEEGYHHVEQAVVAKQPSILLTGHYGNWELASIFSALRGYPIAVLARAQQRLPRLYKLLVSYRESKGCTIIHKGAAMKRLMAAMEAGQPVAIAGDQATSQGVFIDFFGRPALSATGPFELALRKDAVIMPAFIHRVRGPFHRIVVEPPLKLSRHLERSQAVRQGIERFTASLTRHIQEDPGQWLWMHKRWKRTPARRVLILSDGKLGHLKQSRAMAETLREQRPEVSYHVVEVRYRHRLARAWCLLWSWWGPSWWGGIRCLQSALTADSAQALLSRYADVVISCGSSLAPVNALWARENGAKSVVIMNPAPLPLSRFDLVVAPRHDRLPQRRNVVQTVGAVSRLRDEELLQAGEQLTTHPKFRAAAPPSTRPRGEARGVVHRHPVIAALLGGDTVHYALTPAFADALTAQLLAACEAIDGWCLVTTSRRTSSAVEQVLTERLANHPRCRLLLIASRDPIDGTMEGMLGSADVVLVTGESISMVSEACASGRPVVMVEPPTRQVSRATLTRHQRFLRGLAQDGYVRSVPVPELSHAMCRTVRERRPARRLDEFAAIRHALHTLL